MTAAILAFDLFCVVAVVYGSVCANRYRLAKNAWQRVSRLMDEDKWDTDEYHLANIEAHMLHERAASLWILDRKDDPK